jgi:tetratricopeptide (TPR) repeat protein
VDRETRQQLKHDEFRDTLVSFEEYFRNHSTEVLGIAIIVVLVGGLAFGLKLYRDRQEAAANADLGEALSTFRAYVGQPTPGQNEPGGATYATAQEKYKKALGQFTAILGKYKMPPQPEAVAIARYQAGVCQSLLGDHTAAVQTLTEASQAHETDVAAMAKFALAGELASSGKTQEAARLYQELAAKPTTTVPKASALLALADTYRTTQPAQARQIYERVEKEFASNSAVTQAVKQDIASLTP